MSLRHLRAARNALQRRHFALADEIRHLEFLAREAWIRDPTLSDARCQVLSEILANTSLRLDLINELTRRTPTMPIAPIVGIQFRREGRAILEALPAGAQLELLPEPSNQYDPDAIAVYAPSTSIPPESHDALREALLGYGLELEAVLATERHHVGYIPSPNGRMAHLGTDLRAALTRWVIAQVEPITSIPVKLAFNLQGQSCVEFQEDIP